LSRAPKKPAPGASGPDAFNAYFGLWKSADLPACQPGCLHVVRHCVLQPPAGCIEKVIRSVIANIIDEKPSLALCACQKCAQSGYKEQNISKVENNVNQCRYIPTKTTITTTTEKNQNKALKLLRHINDDFVLTVEKSTNKFDTAYILTIGLLFFITIADTNMISCGLSCVHLFYHSAAAKAHTILKFWATYGTSHTLLIT